MQLQSAPRASDRRDSYRLPLDTGAARVVTTDGRSIALLDVSASGMSFFVPRHESSRLEANHATIHLGDLSFDSALDLVRMDLSPDGVRIGSRFRYLGPSTQHALSSFLIRGFLEKNRLPRRLLENRMPSVTWRKPRALHSLLQLHTVESSRRAQLYQKGSTEPSELTLLGIQGGRLLGRPHRGLDLEAERECRVVIAGLGSILHFASSMHRATDGGLELSLPEELHQTGFRDSRRAKLGVQVATVAFLHPHSGRKLEQPIVDVSAKGFSFVLPAQHQLLAPGNQISIFRVRLPDGELSASGIVRGVAARDVGGCSCGVQIVEFADAADERRWNQFVFQWTHDSLTIDAPGAPAVAWSLLNSSEYVALWGNDSTASDYGATWRTMSEKNGHLLLANEGTLPVGTAAGNRLYPKTWLIHHLGFAKEQRTVGKMRQFFASSRELSSGTVHALRHIAAAKYFVIYAEQTKRWNRLLYSSFVESYSDQQASLLTHLKVYSHRLNDSSRSVEGVEIELADRDAQHQFAGRLSQILTPLEIDALSYAPDEIGLAEFTRECGVSGYERTRTIYLARVEGALAAGMIAETGSETANVFGLLNTCRIIDLGIEPRMSGQLKAALIETAKEHYRRANKPQFIFLDDDPGADESVLHRAGLNPIAPGLRWIVRQEVMPAWSSYIDNAFRTSMVLSVQ